VSLEELEEFMKTFKRCPYCNSSEGFWLAPKFYKKYLQCKHCGALIELCRVVREEEKKRKTAKLKAVKESF